MGKGDETRVAVIGGGIAGLTVAWKLLQRGFKVTLFEERVHLGGNLGAHPARMAFRRRRDEWGPNEREELCKVIDLDTGVFRSGEDAKLRGDLDNGVVRPWLSGVAVFHFLKVAKRLGIESLDTLKVDLLAALSGTPTVQRIDDLHGAEDRWLVTYGKVALPNFGPPLDMRFCVAIYEREDGRNVLEVTDAVYHEHCYHMFLEWYCNFWALMKEIGLEKRCAFRSLEQVVHLFPGLDPIYRRSRVLTNPASLAHAGENLLSGAAPPADMFLWMYSMADLISQEFDPSRYLDRRSVHAFLGSRWYSTDESVSFHEHILAKAFAVPTYFSSAHTYRKYVQYTMARPKPMLWVLKEGDSYTYLFKHFEKRLEEIGESEDLTILRGTRVTGISWDKEKIRIKYRPADMRGWPLDGKGVRRSDDDDRSGPIDDGVRERLSVFSPDYVVVAVPPAALAHISGDFRDAVPGLATVRKLQSGVTASLDLRFRRKLPGIPKHHVILRDSSLGLTFVDNAQVWHGDPDGTHVLPGGAERRYDDRPTHLSIAVTDFYKIEGMDKVEAVTAILEDLRRFIAFRDEDIDFTRTYLQMNDSEPLFVNEVGSEPWRPSNVTEIPRLFLAGDFCDNDIGIVSVEGAVVSGLLAVRALQAQLRTEQREISATDKRLQPVPVELPYTEPLVNVEAFKAMLLPHAVAAYLASKQAEFARHPERALTPRDLSFHLEQAMNGLGAAPAGGLRLLGRAAQWIADLHARGR